MLYSFLLIITFNSLFSFFISYAKYFLYSSKYFSLVIKFSGISLFISVIIFSIFKKLLRKTFSPTKTSSLSSIDIIEGSISSYNEFVIIFISASSKYFTPILDLFVPISIPTLILYQD